MLTNNVCLTSVFGRRFRVRSSRGEWRWLARGGLSRLGDEADSVQASDSADILTITGELQQFAGDGRDATLRSRQAVLSDFAFHGIVRLYKTMPPNPQEIPPAPDAKTSGARVVKEESHQALMKRLYSEHNQSLIRFLMTRVDSEQEAQDVAHEAYVRMLQLDTRGAVSYLSAYLFKTAANIAIDRIRRTQTGERVRQAISRALGDAAFPAPEQEIASRQELELIARSLEELPPKCRQAFYLHRIHDMSLDDIARELGVTKRMVHHYLLRAIVHCRSRLDAEAQRKTGNPL